MSRCGIQAERGSPGKIIFGGLRSEFGSFSASRAASGVQVRIRRRLAAGLPATLSPTLTRPAAQ